MLALAIIAKDEIDQIKRIVSKYGKYFSEIAVAYDGDCDELKKEVGSIDVYPYEWIDDFADKRNFLANKIKSPYYFRLDTDDDIENPELIEKIMNKVVNDGIDVVYTEYEYSKDNSGNVNATHWRETIIKKSHEFYWKSPVHENIYIEDLSNFKGIKIPELKIVHNMTMDHAVKSSERNLRILLKDYKENKDNPDPRTLGYIARTLMGQGQHKLAIPFFEKFLTVSGWEEDKYFAWCQLGECHLRDRNFESCKCAAFEAMLADPKRPDAYFILGQMELEKKNYEDAVSWFESVLSKKAPDTMNVVNPTLYGYVTEISMALAYLGKGEIDKANKLYQIAKNKAPEEPYIKNHEKLFTEALDRDRFFRHYIWLSKYLEENDKSALPALAEALPKNLFDDERTWHLRNKYKEPKNWGDKDLVIYCGQAWEEWSPDSVEEGIGGSEEAVIYISQEFKKLGYNVTVFNSILEEKDYDGVIYRPFYEFNPGDNFNILVGWRGNLFKGGIKAKKRYVWLHDVPQPDQFSEEENETFDKIIVLSQYHKSLLPDHIPDEKILVSSNGINLKDFDLDGVKRNPNRLIYTSSYDRGLENILKIWPDIIKEVPEAELHVFYGWNTYDAMVKKGYRSQEFKDYMVKLLDQDGVYEHGRVGHKDLVKEFYKSGIYAYPSHFEEISCISAMKAQACGCVPVTTDYAALNETIKDKTYVVRGNAKNCIDEYKNVIIFTLKQDNSVLSDTLLANKSQFGWDKVAKQWHEDWS